METADTCQHCKQAITRERWPMPPFLTAWLDKDGSPYCWNTDVPVEEWLDSEGLPPDHEPMSQEA